MVYLLNLAYFHPYIPIDQTDYPGFKLNKNKIYWTKDLKNL